MRCKWMALVALAGAVVSVSAGVKAEYLELKESEESRKAYFAQPVRIWGDKGYKAGTDKYNGLLTLANSRTTYAFHLFGTYRDGVATNVQVGMLRPTVFNWSDFLTSTATATLLQSADIKTITL
ncbi:MAG: hypothetical protein IJJ33_03090 [Victivallales bacterium]|nr:hypothetical protein [Victivallales bacterium]